LGLRTMTTASITKHLSIHEIGCITKVVENDKVVRAPGYGRRTYHHGQRPRRWYHNFVRAKRIPSKQGN
jgi:hypothetical protein